MLFLVTLAIINLYICCLVSYGFRLESTRHQLFQDGAQIRRPTSQNVFQQNKRHFAWKNQAFFASKSTPNSLMRINEELASIRGKRQLGLMIGGSNSIDSSEKSTYDSSLVNRSDSDCMQEYLIKSNANNLISSNELDNSNDEAKDELDKIEMHTNNHQHSSSLTSPSVGGYHNTRHYNTYLYNNNNNNNNFGSNINLNYIHSLLVNSNSASGNSKPLTNLITPQGAASSNSQPTPYSSHYYLNSLGLNLPQKQYQQLQQPTSMVTMEQHLAIQNQSIQQSHIEFLGPSMQHCGRQQVGSREPRIVGGNDTYEGEFPWAVSIQRHGNHHCGGVIVGKRWILTAAHCVRSQLIGNLIVRTGGHTLTRNGNGINSHLERDYLVDQIVMHSDFSRYDNLTASQMKSSANTNNADIALIRLKHEIIWNEFAWPVCFPHRESGNFSGHDAVVIGWGKLNEKSEEFSNELQKVKLTIIDNKVCQNWFRQAGRDMPIDDRIICAGFKNGGKDACHGDSGGPLLSKINGHYAVVGVVSTGIGCARPLLPGLYSRVSSYISWIERYVSQV